MRCLFSLFKKQTGKGLVWYARFWDEKVKKYTVVRSTKVLVGGKKERRREAELKANEMLSEIHFEANAADRDLIPYLEGFWKPDSPYVKEWAYIRKKPLSAYYVHLNSVNIKHHIKPFPEFNNRTLRELTAGHIKDWMTWMVDKNLSGRSINSCLNTMRKAVRYAIDREELIKDPFKNIK